MTVLDTSTRLGDFTQENIGPNVPVQIWNGQQGVQITLANQDLVNAVTIARRPNFVQNGSNTAQIPPLGSITVDGSRTIWALAPANTANLLVFPGGGNWAPSPAQVAAQINTLGLATSSNQVAGTAAINNPAYGPATLSQQVTQQTQIPNNMAVTGIPVINNSTLVSPQTTGQVINAGATCTAFTKASVTRPTFEVFLFISNGGNADTSPFSQVNMAWFDSATGQQIASDVYYFTNGSVAGGGYNYHGIGVSHADQLTLSITNRGSTATTYSLIVLQNGKPNPVSTELWNMIFATAGNPASAFANFGGNDPASNVLLNTSVAVGTGTDAIRLMTTYYGRPVNISIHTGSGLSDTFIHVEYPSAMQGQLAFLNSQEVTWGQTDGNGNFFRQIQLPNLPVQVRVTNQNASSRTIEMDVQGA